MHVMQRSEISNGPLLTHLDHLTHFFFLRSCINFAPSIGTITLDGRKLIANYSMIRNDISSRRNEKNERNVKSTRERRHRHCDERWFFVFVLISVETEAHDLSSPPFFCSSLRQVWQHFIVVRVVHVVACTWTSFQIYIICENGRNVRHRIITSPQKACFSFIIISNFQAIVGAEGLY